MDAAGELAQLRERVRELVARGRHELLRGRVVADPVLEQPELQRDPDEPLLGAVVQVALEPPPLRVAGRDDPLARGLQLDQPRLRLGVQVLVLERDRGRRGDRLDELRVVVERGVVDQRRDALAVALDGRDRPVAAGGGQRDCCSGGVGVGLVLRQPVRDDEPGIAERPRQRRLQVAGAHRARARGTARRGRRAPAATAAGRRGTPPGTVTSEQAASHSSVCERVPEIEVVDQQRGEQRQRERARRGSAAARGAAGPRSSTSAARSRRRSRRTSRISSPRWVLSITCATSASGKASSRWPSPGRTASRRPGGCTSGTRERRRPASRSSRRLQARRWSAASGSARRRRRSTDDRRSTVAVRASGESSWPSSGCTKNSEARRGHQQAAVAVRPPPPRDEPERGERAPDEREDDAQPLDRRRALEEDGPECEQLGGDGRDPEHDPEARAMRARCEAAPLQLGANAGVAAQAPRRRCRCCCRHD